MRSSLRVCLSGLVLLGCEPNVDTDGSEEDAWMMGSWSSAGPGLAAYHVTHWQIEPSGVLSTTHVSDCGLAEDAPEEYRWRRVGDDRIEVTDFDGTPMGDLRNPTVFAFRDVCDGPGPYEGLASVEVQDGEEIFGGGYVRGRVCLEEQPPPDDPDVVEWDSCRSVWCEGEPPATLPCLP